MNDTTRFGPWVRRFLLEHLVSERNLARNTQRSYRDTIALLVPFIAGKVRKHIDELDINHVSAENVQQFLQDLEETRRCSVTTRNQRLAVIHALAHFIGQHCPEHIEWCGQLRAIPFKRTPKTSITYLEKSEMDALLAAPDRNTAQGRRDYALLLFLYNSGARADEAAQLTIGDLSLAHAPRRDHSSVTIHGKGNKQRRCPMWPHTANELTALIGVRAPSEHVFLNRCGQPITRFGIHTLVERYIERISTQMPGLAAKRVSPHSIRHYLPFRTMSGTGTPALFCRQMREVGHDIVLTPSISPKLGEGVHREVYYRLPSSSFASAGRPSRVTYRSVCEVTE
jgi:integrase/recombinase XerD